MMLKPFPSQKQDAGPGTWLRTSKGDGLGNDDLMHGAECLIGRPGEWRALCDKVIAILHPVWGSVPVFSELFKLLVVCVFFGQRVCPALTLTAAAPSERVEIVSMTDRRDVSKMAVLHR